MSLLLLFNHPSTTVTWETDAPTWTGSDPGRTWKGPTMIGARRKKTTWNRRYTYDFGDFEELGNDSVTITSATVTATPSGLTFGTPSIGTGSDSAKVQVRISGGTAGVDYLTTCTIVTSGSDTISQDGLMPVT